MKNLFDLPKVSNADSDGYDVQEIKKALNKDQYIKFNNWFSGKTGGMTDDGKFFVYDYDWERFLENELGLLHA